MFRLLTASLVVVSVALAGEAGSRAVTPDFLPVSVWYSGGKARAPMLSTITPESEAQWRADLEQIRSLGFNTVRTWVEWSHCEPKQGEFRFENLKLLCRLAKDAGLRVVIPVYADSAPDWVGRLHPDAMFEAQSGAKVPTKAAPGYCTDKTDVRNLVAGFYTQAAKVASEFPNVVAWDLWSEPHIINWAIITYVPNAQFCYCPHTLARFREWLQAKYGSLDALNKAWYRNLEQISEVQPPRFGTILSYTDFIDWKSFIYDKLAGDLKVRADAVRVGDPKGIITSHAAVPSIFTGPFNGDGASDDFMMARQVDFYGTSLYPKHSFPNRHWPLWQINVATDFTRSANLANGGFYVGELQAGFGTRGVIVSDPVTSEDLRLWMWNSIARGARAVNLYAYYPMSSGYEAGGYGLVELDGQITPRAKEAGKVAGILAKNQDLFLGSKPLRAEVAIVYNPLAQMVGGEQNSGPEGGHRDSLIGYYRAFSDECIPVDFIHRQMVEAGVPEQYKLVILPYPLMLTQKAADGIRAYVERGGCVVTEARLAWNDERGFAAPAIPGMGLSEVFGVREVRVSMSDDVLMRPVATGHPVLAGMGADPLLRGGYFAEVFEPLAKSKVEIIAKHGDDSPAIVASQFGKGKTLAIGSFLGMAAHRVANSGGDAKPDNQFIRNLAVWAGATPRVTRTTDGKTKLPVDVRVLEGDQGMVVVALNHGTSAQKTTISLTVAKGGDCAVQDLVSGQSSKQKVRDGAMKLEVDVSAREVRVLHVTAQ